ncbi:MAG: phosphoglucosamine mutase [Armatimonadetes bacterium]|nr:phosphoglucosamine mutase [Armatimonadota bacterium]MDW8153324.1 phosphoglucosamine mutase [Armatimonadota bacterium]
MARLFGTDGIRGVANDTLPPELAFQVARAAARILAPNGGVFLLGRDTRLSGPMLEGAVVAGLCSAGVSVMRGGVLPTAAVAYLTRALGCDAGVVLSASHNPIEDNGIKFFDRTGYKLPDEVEDEIERALPEAGPRPTGTRIGRVQELVDAEERYLRYLVAHALPARGLRVVVDCAFGAAYRLAPRLWELLGAEVVALHEEPDGARINVGCGSTHPEILSSAVRSHGAEVGFAHDGDADRVIAVDGRGEVVDGDLILVACARYLLRRQELEPRVVVVTVMTNLGVERALEREGVRVVRAPVGDRYVLEHMLKTGAVLGGEQSGHIIFRRLATTGDGLLTSVQLVNAMVDADKPLQELVSDVERLPQVLRNVRVEDPRAALRDEAVQAAITHAAKALGRAGRLLVRPSGTEPVVRIMVEHEDAQAAEEVAQELEDLIRSRTGGT